jgi:hypothetical protein
MLEAVQTPWKRQELTFVNIDSAEGLGFNRHTSYRRKSRSVGLIMRAVTPSAA